MSTLHKVKAYFGMAPMDEYDDEYADQGRKQTPGTVQPKVLEPHRSGLSIATKQDRGDEVPREGEENSYAKQTSRGMGNVEVVGDHCRHGECADAIKAWYVG